MKKNLYVADLHLGHANIIWLSNRNFKNIDEMNETYIKEWNNVVSNEDDVWICGDLFLKSKTPPIDMLKRLKGKKHLIVGNHDTSILKPPIRNLFVSIHDMYTIEDGNDKIVLCHYPICEWNGYFRNVLHFYGHIHNNVETNTYQIMKDIPNAYNVGIDILDGIPRTKEEVIRLNKEFNEKQSFKKLQFICHLKDGSEVSETVPLNILAAKVLYKTIKESYNKEEIQTMLQTKLNILTKAIEMNSSIDFSFVNLTFKVSSVESFEYKCLEPKKEKK